MALYLARLTWVMGVGLRQLALCGPRGCSSLASHGQGDVMPESIRYAAIMLAAGIGIPILAALNAQLGARIGSPTVAAVVLFCIALLGAVVVMFATQGPAGFSAVAAQPKHLFLAGLLICFYVLSVTFVAPRFGVGNAVFFVLMGQMISAALIDQFGLFGAIMRPLTVMRASGLGVMALGLYMIQRA